MDVSTASADAPSARPAEHDVLLSTHGVTKSYSGVTVLHDVSLEIRRGEVLGLAGENGAGKSTVLSLITGMIRPNAGRIAFRGEDLPANWTPVAARTAGIGSVHQELSLNPHQSVAENLFLGHWPTRRGIALHRDLAAAAAPFLAEVGLEVPPDRLVGRLTLGEMQLLELAKALVSRPELLILDEVTSALDETQTQHVFGVVRRLVAGGASVVIVTHRMSELFALCDRITVLKDGEYVATREVAAIDEDGIVQLMLGRSLSSVFPEKSEGVDAAAQPLLSVHDLAVPGHVSGVSFDLAPGTITGIGGLQGQGQTEVLRALFGLARHQGNVRLAGTPVRLSSPRQAIAHRVIYVPADRKVEGVHVDLSVAGNIQLPNMSLIAQARTLGTIMPGAARRLVTDMIERLQIKARPQQEVRRLSGGNQQKVALAKWLPSEPRVLLLAEPTRGIDVGTKREIYRLLREFAAQGGAVLVTSGDTLELIGLCDSIHVMYEGLVVAHLRGDEVTEERLVHASVVGADARGLEAAVCDTDTVIEEGLR